MIDFNYFDDDGTNDYDYDYDADYYDEWPEINPHDTYDDIDEGYFSFTEHSNNFDDVDWN